MGDFELDKELLDKVAERHRLNRHDYLEQARRAVVERGAAYGHPRENHAATAAVWRVYLERRFGLVVPVDAEDVCHLMDMQKTIREANVRKPDNVIDKIGYMQNIGMIRRANEAKEEA